MQITSIQKKIHEVRGLRIMLDRDLAKLYETPTKSLNLAVKRNVERFPSDFMFQLSQEEFTNLRFQNETSSYGGTRYMPYAFTEFGVAMLSSVLRSPKAIQVNISIMRAFVALKQYAFNYSELKEKIGKLERKYNKKFKDVYEVLHLLLSEKDWKGRDRIGFIK